MQAQDELLKQFSSSLSLERNEIRPDLVENPKRVCLKITNGWKKFQSISFGCYIDIDKDEVYKNRWEISISFTFIWEIELLVILGKI